MEMEAAFVMKDDNLRSLLQRVSKLESCFQEELITGEGDYDTPGMLSQLEMLGLINKEFFVSCLKTGMQISRVNSITALDEARALGLKCFNCGRLISEEKISVQVSCSEQGKKFSKPNYWLALHLLYVLEDLGINIDKVYYKIEKNNRIFDLFVNTLGEFFMFEVKDEPVRLQDIFMFLSRVQYFKPFRAILVSAHPVPLDVRMYLKNYIGSIPLTLVEGLDELDAYVAECFRHKREIYLEKVFRSFRPETSINILKMFEDKFFAGKEYMPITVDIPVRKEVRKKAPKEEDVFGKIEGFTEVIPGEELDDMPSVTEEMPDILETMEIKPEITLEIPIPEENIEEPEEVLIPEDEDESLPEDMEIPEEPSELEQIQAIEEETRHTKVIETPFEEKPHREEQEFAMEFMESLPTEILPMVDIPISADNTEEELEAVADDILETVNGEGVAGHYLTLETKLHRINNIGNFKAALADMSGLVICSAMGAETDADSLCAYSSIILQTIQNSLEESGLEKASSIHIEGKTGRIKIYPGDGALIAAVEERKFGEVEDEGGMLPGEVVLREAILKKVLEDLSKADGVEGNLIVGKDGLIIESNISGDKDPDTIAYFTGIIMSEDEQYFESLKIGALKHILIKTSNTLYNMIPIEGEAILATCLDPLAPREVWQSQLPQAALMIKSALS
jgi:predicted regulator of Ras-like GTPase activity (Roadblock/LC7/MglB family)